MKKIDYTNITVITPTLNEEENIGIFIEALNKLYKGIKIIVADDGSTDNTQKIIKSKGDKYCVELLDRSKEQIHGLTVSVADAILSTKTDFFICMDSDLQHPPEKISEIRDKFKENDFVIATREGVVKEWPLSRRIISKSAIFMGKIRLLHSKFKHEDLMSGFFGGKTSFVKPFLKNHSKFEMRGYKVLFDLLKQFPNDVHFARVNYIFGVRRMGTSKMGSKPIIYYISSLLK